MNGFILVVTIVCMTNQSPAANVSTAQFADLNACGKASVDIRQRLWDQSGKDPRLDVQTMCLPQSSKQ